MIMTAIRIILNGCLIFKSSNYLISKLSIIPHRISAAAHVVAQLEPEGEDHVDDQWGADSEAGGVDKEKANILDGHAQLVTYPGTNPKSIILYEKFKCV